MADAAAPAPAAPAKKAAKPKKAQAKPTHPAYAVMISDAIKALGERTGSSRQAILKYIVATYKVGDEKAGVRLKLALKKMVQAGALRQVKGAGASGSFKLAKDEAKPKAAKKVVKAKSPAAKKAVKAKKPAAKKAKKPAAKTKKPAAKKAKKPAKKPAAKAASKPKKSAAKKPAPKKTKKPAPKK